MLFYSSLLLYSSQSLPMLCLTIFSVSRGNQILMSRQRVRSFSQCLTSMSYHMSCDECCFSEVSLTALNFLCMSR